MKLNKKKVFTLALAVCLIAILSMSTLAWFTAEDEVTNNFYVGDSTTDPDDVFGVDVWEYVDPDGDGTADEVGKGDTSENGATYEKILPGEKLTKQPYLTNTGVHPMYVRAIVTVSPAEILKDAMGEDWNNADLFLAGTNADNWVLDSIVYTNDGTNSQLVYTYYYQHVLAAGATTDDIFDAVVIPTGLTTAQAVAMEGFEVNVLGQAIQSEHIQADNAKDAFETYWEGVPEYESSYWIEEIVYSNVTLDAPIVVDEEAYAVLTLDNSTVTGTAVLDLDATIATAELVDVTATVDNVVEMSAANTIIIAGGNYMLSDGGKLVLNTSGDTTIQLCIVGDVTVNGEVLNSENIAQYLDTGVHAYFY